MKSYVATSSDPANPEKFLAYMAPAPGEVCIKSIYDFNFETLVVVHNCVLTSGCV